MSVNDASRTITDDSRVMLQIVASLSNNSRGVIYDRNMFIVQAIGQLHGIPTPKMNSCSKHVTNFNYFYSAVLLLFSA
jgi:hypothetical protein